MIQEWISGRDPPWRAELRWRCAARGRCAWHCSTVSCTSCSTMAEGVGRGFDSLESYVKNGTFDRVLLRPRSTLLQVLGAALAPETIGRLVLAALVLGWGLAALDGGAVAGDVALLLWAFAGGVAAFFALLMLSAALSFWTTETLLIFAIVTKGGLETTQYPISVFHRALRYLFLFMVPIGTVTYFPVVHVLGRPDPLGTSAVVAWLAPLAGFVSRPWSQSCASSACATTPRLACDTLQRQSLRAPAASALTAATARTPAPECPKESLSETSGPRTAQRPAAHGRLASLHRGLPRSDPLRRAPCEVLAGNRQ